MHAGAHPLVEAIVKVDHQSCEEEFVVAGCDDEAVFVSCHLVDKVFDAVAAEAVAQEKFQ